MANWAEPLPRAAAEWAGQVISDGDGERNREDGQGDARPRLSSQWQSCVSVVVTTGKKNTDQLEIGALWP